MQHVALCIYESPILTARTINSACCCELTRTNWRHQLRCKTFRDTLHSLTEILSETFGVLVPLHKCECVLCTCTMHVTAHCFTKVPRYCLGLVERCVLICLIKCASLRPVSFKSWPKMQVAQPIT